jgi:hypothetical protein
MQRTLEHFLLTSPHNQVGLTQQQHLIAGLSEHVEVAVCLNYSMLALALPKQHAYVQEVIIDTGYHPPLISNTANYSDTPPAS